jgi:hypothetical protein
MPSQGDQVVDTMHCAFKRGERGAGAGTARTVDAVAYDGRPAWVHRACTEGGLFYVCAFRTGALTDGAAIPAEAARTPTDPHSASFPYEHVPRIPRHVR